MNKSSFLKENVGDIAFAEDTTNGTMYEVLPIWSNEALATLVTSDGDRFKVLVGDLYDDYNLYDRNHILISEPSISESYDGARKNTNRLLELIEDGVLDKDNVIMCLVKYMSDEAVGDCCKANEIYLFNDQEEEAFKPDSEFEEENSPTDIDELIELITTKWHEDDIDPIEDDIHFANLYGGERLYCDCGRRLVVDSEGYTYCPDCEPERALDDEADVW